MVKLDTPVQLVKWETRETQVQPEELEELVRPAKLALGAMQVLKVYRVGLAPRAKPVPREQPATRVQPALKVLLHQVVPEPLVKPARQETPATPVQLEHWDTVVRKAYVETPV
jgi:hypothetical protein